MIDQCLDHLTPEYNTKLTCEYFKVFQGSHSMYLTDIGSLVIPAK